MLHRIDAGRFDVRILREVPSAVEPGAGRDRANVPIMRLTQHFAMRCGFGRRHGVLICRRLIDVVRPGCVA